MPKGIRLAAALGIGLIATFARAADWPIYIGAGYGESTVDGTAHTDGLSGTAGLPTEIPLNGLPLNDEGRAWSAFAGYEVLPYLAVELGYLSLGTFESDVRLLPSQREQPRIEVTSRYLAARFRYPFDRRFAATWHLGVSEAQFEVEGSVSLQVRPSPVFPFPPRDPPLFF